MFSGNLELQNEPFINKLFSQTLKQIMDNTWFKDVEFTSLKNVLNFNNVVFRDKIIVEVFFQYMMLLRLD